MFEPYIPLELPLDVDGTAIAKSNIRGILDSYHGDWDFLIELLQNAVDALDEKFGDPSETNSLKPEIEIVINEKAGTVRVTDNGIGMEQKKAMKILIPGYTDKPYFRHTRRSLRGHKGVGLSFLAFGFNFLRFCSKKDNEFFSADMSGGKLWVDGEEDMDVPKVNPSDYCPEFLEGIPSGTSMELLVDSDYLKHASIDWLGWHFIIRCLTAAGYCDINGLASWNKAAVLTFKLIDSNGVKINPPDGYKDQLPLEYFYPDNILKSCNLDDYFSKYSEMTEPPKTERGKYEALYVKWDTDKIESVLFDKGDIEDKDSVKYKYYLFTKSHIPSIYAMFTHSQRVWKERLDQNYSSDKRRKFWRPGIQIVTQQMPTGQIQEVSLKFRTGNRDRFFMLVELPDAKPDYGRKGFKSEINDYVQYIAERIIQEYFLNKRVLLKPTSIAHGGTATDAEATADHRIDEVKTLPDIGFSALSFKKEPQYENDVIALFAELVARDYIRGFEILSVSSGEQYDGVVNYIFTKNPDKLPFHATNNRLGIPKSGPHPFLVPAIMLVLRIMTLLRLPMHILLAPYYPVNRAVDLYYTAGAKILPSRVHPQVIRTSFHSSTPGVIVR